MLFGRRKTSPEAFADRTLEVAGRSLTLKIKRNDRARRLSLKVDHHEDAVVITLPHGVAEAAGLAFLEKNRGWLESHVDAMPERIAFADGVEIPLRGEAHRIVHCPEARNGVWLDDGIINVSGAIEHLPRRLCDFLKKEARRDITPLVREKAAAVSRVPSRISIRDQRTRWGSCSASGDLSFNWRLILAPPGIMDYLVAHEVAHMVELNHSSRFWAVVAQLTPEPKAARAWLRRNGHALHRIG